MDKFTYQELLAQLEDTDVWLCRQGLTQQLDRMRVNKRNVAFLVQALEQGTLDKFMESASFEHRSELMCSLVEATEFADSLSALRRQGCTVPTHVLKAALDGPVDLRLEGPNNNRARNIMFEIAIAGRFARSGLNPVLGREPDILVELHNRRIFVQCKRVFSERGLSSCLSEAGDQLKRDLRLACNPRDCGLIALSISRIFQQGDKVLVAANEPTLRHKLRDEVDAVRTNLANHYRRVKEPKIAGLIYHLATPAVLQDSGLYTAAHSVAVDPMPRKSDAALLRDIAAHLEC